MNSARPPPHKRQVAESSLDFLMMQVVTYFLHGPGAAAYVPPVPSAVPDGNALPPPPLLSPADAAAAAAETRRRLEGVGYDVGHRLVERYAVEKERMDSDLEAVKFVCRDFWEGVFKKHVDVLRTNHKGLYVLTDNKFRWLGRVWADEDSEEGGAGAVGADGAEVGGAIGGRGKPEDYVVFPCGLICGALTRLGVRCRVTAEIAGGAQCKFSVQVIGG
ncbi:hypothetical protein BU14_0076s0006 [Porphyra umbilicalis]|uniref:Trafficking protein particle complex subunit 6B n=1 Tax=Porphyra umbilicalis TaxID=2786 RepID=A0A1X6PF38_PORUM|nr:hypothetical protein BU14_0076s0006 [Porphyra umbilicalis]|eukprot:OSX79450.1 hypothetical protein BU14_0076s0006 [Porphyra umbilicalis]